MCPVREPGIGWCEVALNIRNHSTVEGCKCWMKLFFEQSLNDYLFSSHLFQLKTKVYSLRLTSLLLVLLVLL